MNPDELAAQQKAREIMTDVDLKAGVWPVIRLDGRSFHNATARYAKPFDPAFSRIMVETATAVMTDFGAVLGYTQSDEITVVLPAGTPLFGRRVEKLTSVAAGIASAWFTWRHGQPAGFDARIVACRGISEVVDNLSWRQADAARNAIEGHACWALRGDGLSPRAATKRLHGLDLDAKRDWLDGRGLLPSVEQWQQTGHVLRWVTGPHGGHNSLTGKTVATTRRRISVEGAPGRDEWRRLVADELAGRT